MAPSYRSSRHAAHWQRPSQPDPHSHAFYVPTNGVTQYNGHVIPTPVGSNHALHPVFAGFAGPPPPPAPRNTPGLQQQGPAQSRSTWGHQRLDRQQAYPVLGQHLHQQQRHLLQAPQSASHLTGQPKQAGQSLAPFNVNAKPFVVGSPSGSASSSGISDKPEASDMSSVGSTMSSVQSSTTGEYFW